MADDPAERARAIWEKLKPAIGKLTPEEAGYFAAALQASGRQRQIARKAARDAQLRELWCRHYAALSRKAAAKRMAADMQARLRATRPAPPGSREAAIDQVVRGAEGKPPGEKTIYRGLSER